MVTYNAESGVGGALFMYASDDDWKSMKVSIAGLINIRRIKEKVRTFIGHFNIQL